MVGGIRPKVWTSAVLGSQIAAARLFLRAKAVPEKGAELLSILSDVLFGARLDNRERLQQLVLEEKASKESSLVPRGSHFVDMQLRANLHEADWAEEQIGGVSYPWFLRKLSYTAIPFHANRPPPHGRFEGGAWRGGEK
jgi:Zn-dependent M16 (insulinase) family peptidase